MLGFTYLMDVMDSYSADPARDLQRAYELAQKALALDDTVSGPYMFLSQVNLRRAQEARNLSDAKRYNALAANYASPDNRERIFGSPITAMFKEASFLLQAPSFIAL